MTFVGKILVILIVVFSLIFLGVSTVVFTTATNWNEKSKDQATKLQKSQGQLRDAQAKVTDAEGKLKTAREEHAALLAQRETRINDLDKQTKDAEKEMTDARSQLEVAQKNAQVSLAEATARKGEIDVLAETLSRAQAQANQFNQQNIELTDRIRILEREKTTAEQNAKDLRSSTAKLMAWARTQGLKVGSLAEFDANSVPPDVHGQVKDVNPANNSVEITIGSNDGLAVGQEFFLFRTATRPEYLGKVKIVSVYPNKAVADVIGQTVNRKKIQEGDIVSSTLNAQ